jgi:hypothetical protein
MAVEPSLIATAEQYRDKEERKADEDVCPATEGRHSPFLTILRTLCG